LLNDTYKLNHCKEMGAKPGRRFLIQPAAKLEPVIVDSDDSLVSKKKKNLSQTIDSLDWRPWPGKVGQKLRKHPHS